MGKYGRRLLQIALLCGAVSLLTPPLTTHASGSWTMGEFSWGERKKQPAESTNEHCQTVLTDIVGVTSLPESARLCVYDRPDFRYATYSKYINLGYGGYTQSYFVIGIGNDQNMYVVDNMDGQRLPLDVPGSDDLHFNTLTMGFTNNHLLTYIPNFPKKLHKTTSLGQPTRYQLVDAAEQPFIPYNQSQSVTTGAVGVSDNGDWIVAEVMGAGFIRIDTATRKIYGFSNYVHRYGVGSDAHITFRVTNDGTKVAAFDYNISPVIYSLDATCLATTEVYSEEFATKLHNQSCPTDDGRLYGALVDRFSSVQARGMSATKFNTDGDMLYFDEYVYEDENDWMNPTIYQTPLYAAGYAKEHGIEYMALGDSFTSGEGDIEKQSDGSPYYLPGTVGKNECHLSSRSYPFLIRDKLAIATSRMESVACSGAQILPDYMGPSETYLGQGNRLQHLSAAKLMETKEAALSDFSPGNIPQLEFIKKYQPKTITLMGGGNDVGFARILQYCASPTWEMAFINDTCGYAVKGSSLQKMFVQTIQSQYQYTLLLLRKIKQASPYTTVYIVGYPSFISENPDASCFNSAALDSNERMMINEGVTFMNTMLEAAATSMGMRYVDIQDTLKGGRLCEGSEYVTGLADLGPIKMIDSDIQEAFHPNAKAHKKFAERILADGFQAEAGRNGDVLAESVELDTPSYFGTVGKEQTIQKEVTADTVTEQTTFSLYLPSGSLAAGSNASFTMYSKAVDLGGISVDGEGGIDASVTLPPSLKPGRHILVLDGHTPSGEPVQYFQFVTIVSSVKDDADDDGVPDAKDPCPFITGWVDEATGQDACLPLAGQDEDDNSVAQQRTADSSQSSQKASFPEERLAPHSSRQISRNSMDNDDTPPKSVPEVLGAHTLGKSNKYRPESNEFVNKFLIGGAIGLSTLLLGYAIVRYRQKRI